jgi:hypothetical protein
MTSASTANDITPISTRRHSAMDDFKLAPGWFVLNENKMIGTMPRHDAHLMGLYKELDSIARKAYYAAVKHCISSPFGYWVNDAGRGALEEEIAELQAYAAEKNEEAASLVTLSGAQEFRAIINFVFVRNDPADPVLRRRLPSFLVERLEAVKEKLRTLDPETDKKALVYTQDQTKRLHTMIAVGRYSQAIQRAGDSAREIAHEIKVEPSKQESMDFSRIDEAIGMLRRVEEGMGD